MDKLRNGGFGPGDRNAGLRETLQSDSGRARNAAIRDDKPIQDALATGKITRDELVAHHLVPMQAVRDFPVVFGPAADAGWRPDSASNIVILPRSVTAQQHLAARPNGITRPYHDNSHKDWNGDALAEIEQIQSRLLDSFPEGSPEWGRAARQMLEELCKKLRRRLPSARVTMLQNHQSEYG